MQNKFDLAPLEQGLLEQILTDLEVKASDELALMQAEGDRLIAEALAQKTPLAILHRRVGNREKLEAFLHHAHAIREIPAVHRSVMRNKISDDFVGELELRAPNHDAEVGFRNAVSEAAPFFKDITATEEDGCLFIRATAELFGLVPFTDIQMKSHLDSLCRFGFSSDID